MSNWVIYSSFSKHAFWNKLTEQLNRTNQTASVVGTDQEYFVTINEVGHATGKQGVNLLHWTKMDHHFKLDISEESRDFVIVQPSNERVEDNPFKRIIDTAQLEQWLSLHEWVGFGYVMTPGVVDKYQAMERSRYYTRDQDSNFVVLSNNETYTEITEQPIQHWFIASRAANGLYIIYCHPDILIPHFGIDYQQDKNNNTFYTYLEESFDYYDLFLKPKAQNATIVNDVIYSKDEWIILDFSKASHFCVNSNAVLEPIAPSVITTDIQYEVSNTQLKIKNTKGVVTVKYNVPILVKPSILVKEAGIIERTYIILGE
jgi:hypothetical protein